MSERVVGAILAGGQSRRMGTAKAGVRLDDDSTLSERVLQALSQVCDEVVVLGHGEGCPEGLERLADPPGKSGPLAGLLALLQSGRGARYLVAACDMPLLSHALLARLVEEGAGAEAACFVAEGQRELEPLPLLLSPSARPPLEERLLRGELRLMAFVAALSPRLVPLSENDAALLANANRPEDLERLRGGSR